VSVLTTLQANAYDFEVDGIYYKITSADQKTVEVAKDGSYSGDVVLPASVTYNEETYSVTGIGSRTFYNCTEVTSVSVPKGVTYIGEYAFSNCPLLSSITLPEGVTSIGYEGFSSCTDLTSITIPASVAEIGEKVFFGMQQPHQHRGGRRKYGV